MRQYKIYANKLNRIKTQSKNHYYNIDFERCKDN